MPEDIDLNATWDDLDQETKTTPPRRADMASPAPACGAKVLECAIDQILLNELGPKKSDRFLVDIYKVLKNNGLEVEIGDDALHHGQRIRAFKPLQPQAPEDPPF